MKKNVLILFLALISTSIYARTYGDANPCKPTMLVTVNSGTDNGKGTTSLTYQILEYPGMAYTNAFDVCGTTIVGQTNDASFTANHGFIYNGSIFTIVDYPGAQRTWVTGIDAQGSGSLAGYYLSGGTYYGFYKQGADFHSLTYPGASRTYASDIYGSTVVGYYYNGTANFGFVYNISTSTFAPLNPPNSYLTEIHGIYGDKIVGQYRNGYNGPYYSFIYTISTASWTSIDNPEQAGEGIRFCNVDATHVVGYYTIPIQVQKSFYYEIATATFSLIQDYSGAVHTFAYGIDGTGTIVGYVENSSNQKGFIVPIPPSVTTLAVNNIGGISATGNGNLTNLGITDVISHGVCWNTSGSPTISSNHTDKGTASSTGAFTSTMTGLSGTTTYYVRAYATGSNGATAYGEDVSFSTTEAWVLNLYDTGGNGWNGGVINLNVDGVLKLSKTMESGAGPDSYTFEAICGQVITTNYYPGSYSSENEYTIVNPSGTIVAQSGQGGTVPGNITYGYYCGTAGTVSTQAAGDISYTTATGNGNITGMGTNNPTEHGFCWNTSGSPTTSNSHTNEGAASATGAFTSAITGLTQNTLYYVRAYIYDNMGYTYGDQVSFTTLAYIPGTVSTQAVSNIAQTTATGNGNVTSIGSHNPTDHGVCWKTSTGPTIANFHTNNGVVSTTGAFIASMTGLAVNTKYYVRAYITDITGNIYGEEVSFTTLANIPGTVSTQAVSNIAQTTATGNGNVTSLGTQNPTQHGVCWKTTTGPTIANSKTTGGAVSAIGPFTSSMTGLSANTKYYVRAYITDITGTIYGEEVSFTTLSNLPGTVTTQAVTGITAVKATGNGNVTSIGTRNPTQHGVCWNTSTAPTTSNSRTADGAISATGPFTSSITGLNANTTYYVRAYITDVTGTIYGEEVIFTTTEGIFTGNGSLLVPFQIYNLTDLQDLSGNSDYWSSYFIQTADIDATATSAWNPDGLGGYYGFSPIGNATNNFRGNYNGQTYTISNIYIYSGSQDNQGLFGYVYTSTIKNLGLTNVNITGRSNVGGLVGNIFNSTISNAYVTGSVTAVNLANGSNVGGLAGNFYSGAANDCYSSGTVSGLGYTGGLVGSTGSGAATISRCYSTATVNSSYHYIGGLVGYAGNGTIENCYSKGDVTHLSGTNNTTASFCGASSNMIIRYCYSTGKVIYDGATSPTNKGFIGGTPTGTTTANFFDSQTSLQTTGTGATAKTTADMKTQTTFTNVAWDFVNVWNMNGTTNNGYAFLLPGVRTWNGNTNTTWGTASNWDGSILPASFSNIIIPVVANNPVIASGSSATCNDVTISSGASLIIKSDVAGTGSLITSGTVTGDVTIQRYITGNSELTQHKYHLVSVPLVPATNSLSQLFLGSYLYQYLPASNTWNTMGTTTTNELDETVGYMIYYPGENTTYSFTGAPNTGSFTPTITYPGNSGNNNFALVPNPYPSNIDWNAASGWTKTRVSTSIWVYNPTYSNYATWNGSSSTNGGSRYIGVGQAFFVQTTAANPALTMNNSVRTHTSATFLKEGNTLTNQLRLRVDANDMADELLVGFASGAGNGYDAAEDALKLYGDANAPQIYTLAGDYKTTINMLGDLNGSLQVQLNYECGAQGEVTFVFSQLESYPANTFILLEDLLTGAKINLQQQSVYTFDHLTGNDPNRFKLWFGNVTAIPETTTQTAKMWINGNNLYINATGLTGQQALVEVYNPAGQRLLSKSIVLNDHTTLQLNLKGFVIVKLTSGKQVLTTKGILMK